MMLNSEQKAKSNIGEQLIEQSKVPVENELERLLQELDTDIRENLPPQMLAVVVGVLKLIEGIERGNNES